MAIGKAPASVDEWAQVAVTAIREGTPVDVGTLEIEAGVGPPSS